MKQYNKEKKFVGQKEISRLKTIVCAQLGLNNTAINSRVKNADNVNARLIFSNILMFELEIPVGKMSQFVNKDRSNFYHYIKLHNQALEMPKFYQEYLRDYEICKDEFLNKTHTKVKKWQIMIEKLSYNYRKLDDKLNNIQRQINNFVEEEQLNNQNNG